MEELVKKIGKNTIWSLTGKVVSTITSIVIIFLIARTLGPEDYGKLVLMFTLINVIYPLTSLGLEQSLPYMLQKYNNSTSNIVRQFIKTRLPITMAVSAIMIISARGIAGIYGNESLTGYIVITGVSLPLFTLMNSAYYIYQGLNNMKKSMITEILFSVTRFAALLLIMMGLGVTGGLIGYLVSYAVATIFAYIAIRRELKSEEKHGMSFSFALTLYASILLIMGSTYLINMILGFNIQELGYYDSANRISLLLTLLPSAIGVSLLPSIVNNDKETISKLTGKFLKYSMIYVTPILIVILAISGFVINLLLGSEYLAGINVIRILSVSIALQVITTFYEVAAQAAGKPKYLFIANMIKVGIIVVLSSNITNALNGAAISLGISIAALVFYHVKLKGYIKHELKNYAKILAYNIPLIITLSLDYNITLKIVISALMLIVSLVFTYKKALEAEDKVLIRKLLNKITKSI